MSHMRVLHGMLLSLLAVFAVAFGYLLAYSISRFGFFNLSPYFALGISILAIAFACGYPALDKWASSVVKRD